MTYILGWKNYSSVFLVGDSVITIEHPNVDGNKNTFRNQTSFGEDHIYEKGKTVSEKWLKLYDIEGKVIIAISGEVRDAYDGIESLKKAMASQDEFDLREEIKYSFFGKRAGVIIGFMENENPVLISCHCKGYLSFIEHPTFEVVHSGSINEKFKDQTQSAFSQFKMNGWNDDQILASIIAVTQSFCFQENIISQGVGGFFSGIRIDKTGVKWQPDLVFIPFSYNGKEPKTNQLAEIFGEVTPVMTQVRESILFSCSSLVDDIKKAREFFPNFFPEKGVDLKILDKQQSEWDEKWEIQLNKNCDALNAEFFIFYNTQKPIVALIYSKYSKPFEIKNDKISFKYPEINTFIIGVFSAVDDELTFIHDF